MHEQGDGSWDVPPRWPLRNETLTPPAAGHAAGRRPSAVGPLWGSPPLKTTALPQISSPSEGSPDLPTQDSSKGPALLFSLPGLVFQITA